MHNIKQQLSKLKFSKDVRTNLELSNNKSPEQKRLIETVITLLATTLEDEMLRCNAAINAVIVYCQIKEGSCHLSNCNRGLTRHITSATVKVEENIYPLVVTEL